MRLGGGKDEFDVGRRFLQRLQQGIEGVGGEHVDFVDDDDLVATPGREIADRVAEFPDVIDSGIGSAVDLKHVDRVAVGDLLASGAGIARFRRCPLFAVERLGHDSGGTGFTHPAGAGKEKGVSDTAGGQGIGQGPADMLLTDQVGKGLGTIFSGQDEIRHARLKNLFRVPSSSRIS